LAAPENEKDFKKEAVFVKFKKMLAFLMVAGSFSGLIGSDSVVFANETQIQMTQNDSMDTSDGVRVSTYRELADAVSSGKSCIYVVNSIDMEDGIIFEKGEQSLIGVPLSDGTLPVLNFEKMKGQNDIVNNKSSDSDVAIRVSSANNVIKNLIVEKSHDNGILIKGVGVVRNEVSNCILRYNNDSGIQITGGACGNVIKGVYSYRNCDVFTLGGNADGFAVKLGAGIPSSAYDLFMIQANRNYFYDCYAWENSDDAWDSFDKDTPDQSESFQAMGGYWTYRNDYVDCMCWNNGTPENAFGYNDYVKGLSLDENLPIIRRFKDLADENVYNDFVKAYNDGSLCEKSADKSVYFAKLDDIFGEIPTSKGAFKSSQFAFENWGGNPNGFKLGSKFTRDNSMRFMKNCIAFDHLKYGFDKNNSGAKIYAENCISFGNKVNYYLDGYTAYKWENINGWSGKEPDSLPKADAGVNMEVKNLSDKENVIRSAADEIVKNVNANKTTSVSVFEWLF